MKNCSEIVFKYNTMMEEINDEDNNKINILKIIFNFRFFLILHQTYVIFANNSSDF